jgi:peptidoglycan/xylan/chitin deacetylase (PgdA/CDA1 family)
MYHYISEPPPDADNYRLDLSLAPQTFADQMNYLDANGYTTIDLYHLIDALTWGRPLPDKPIILTFDDGYRDNYENAFPILRQHGFTATFFILTEPIDRGSDRYMTWSQVEEMAAAGMDIEPHSKTHPDLRGQPRDYLVWEILGSAQTVEAHIGRYPRFFAYPSGWYDEALTEFLQEIEFWGAVTTWYGWDHTWIDRYRLQRIRINGGDSALVLAEKLRLEPLETP